jgi:hypothetical protein
MLRRYAAPAHTLTPMIIGYSDRINHALAFAAKHHDQQVRKGTRLPYLTRPANVAVVLTRYGCDDDIVVAGILHDVVGDCVRDGQTREMLEQRIGHKFGTPVLETSLEVAERRHDDDGVEMSREERKRDLLERLGAAGDRARWIVAADAVHGGGSLLADLRRTLFPETVWGRFTAGREGTIRWHRQLYDRLEAVGFNTPIMRELLSLVQQLEEHSEELPGVR